jgi:hypothetical protein
MAVSKPVLVVAVGSRDLKVEHPDVEALRELLREEWQQQHDSGAPPDFTRRLGEYVLDHYDDLRDAIRLPILDPLLTLAQQRYAGEARATLYLVATDQPPAVAWHYENDTLAAARVIARWLSEPAQADRYALGAVRGAVDDGDAAQFILGGAPGTHPADYRAQYLHWDRVFATLRHRHQPRAGHHLFVGVTGGTPQVNAALMLRGVKHFRNACSVLYVPQGQSAGEVAIGGDIWREQVREDFEAALADARYQTAFDLVRRSRFCFQQPELVEAAVRLLAARADFDFARAREALAPLRDPSASAAGPLAEELRRQDEELAVLLQERPSAAREAARLRELFHNAALQFGIGHFADFLARYIALLDSLQVFLTAQVIGDWTVTTPDGLAAWAGRVRAEPRYDRVRVRLERLANREREIGPPHAFCFDQILSDPASGHQVSPAQQRARRYIGLGLARCRQEEEGPRPDADPNWQNTCLNDLRNESLIAHGFAGVSRRAIKQRYRSPYYETSGDGALILRDLRAALASIGVETGASPYQRLATLLRQPGVAIAAE